MSNPYLVRIQAEVDIEMSDANGYPVADRTAMVLFLTPGNGVTDGGITGLVDPDHPFDEDSYNVLKVIEANENYKNAVGPFRDTLLNLCFFSLNVAIEDNTGDVVDDVLQWIGQVDSGGTGDPATVVLVNTIDPGITIKRVSAGVFRAVTVTVGVFGLDETTTVVRLTGLSAQKLTSCSIQWISGQEIRFTTYLGTQDPVTAQITWAVADDLLEGYQTILSIMKYPD